jgi:hypothetical protein
MDRTELLSRMRDGRAELENALKPFNQHDLSDPLLPNGWSIKDMIAHFGFWERRMVTLYGILSSGENPEDLISDDTLDELNAHVYDNNQLIPWGIVQVNEREAYEALLEIAETAPEEDLFDTQRFAWTEGEPFYNWIAVNTYGHYSDHIPDLTRISSAD